MLYSGVIEHLAEMGTRVVILVPKGKFASLSRIVTHKNVVFEDLPLFRARIAQRWNRVYFYLFQTMLPTSSSQARLEWIKLTDIRRYQIITKLGERRLKWLRKMWLSIRRVLFPPNLYAPIFQRFCPDLVVVGTAGLNLEEYYLLRFANLHNIRSLCALQSWDLLTTKGDILERPDKLLVWNEENVRETIDLFGYDANSVRALGVPHFDLYFRSQTYAARDDWLLQQGLDPQRHLIFITPAASHIHKNLTEVVYALVDGINQDRFVRPIQVLIRPHPSVYHGFVSGIGTETDLQHYESLCPYVKGNRPSIAPDRLSDNMDPDEMFVLANCLQHASIVIDFYGTVGIEAAIVDTPVIYADTRASFYPSNSKTKAIGIDYTKYTHLRAVFKLGGARTAFNQQELYSLINNYLENPDLDQEGRKRVAAAFCGTLDGHAAERIAYTIHKYAQGHWPTDIE